MVLPAMSPWYNLWHSAGALCYYVDLGKKAVQNDDGLVLLDENGRWEALNARRCDWAWSPLLVDCGVIPPGIFRALLHSCQRMGVPTSSGRSYSARTWVDVLFSTPLVVVVLY